MTPDSQQLLRSIEDLRREFDELRRRYAPLKVELIHRTISSDPPPRFSHREPAVVTQAGLRSFHIQCDSNGLPILGDSPVLDSDGQPIVNPAGKPLSVRPCAIRHLCLYGDGIACAQLNALTERGGRLLRQSPVGIWRAFSSWNFRRHHERWWAHLFESSWAGDHPTLVANRMTWITDADGLPILVPYDSEELRMLAEQNQKIVRVPPEWLKTPPDAFVSTIDDAAAACSDLAALLCDHIMSQGTSAVKSENCKHADEQPTSHLPEATNSVGKQDSPGISTARDYELGLTEAAQFYAELTGTKPDKGNTSRRLRDENGRYTIEHIAVKARDANRRKSPQERRKLMGELDTPQQCSHCGTTVTPPDVLWGEGRVCRECIGKRSRE